MTQFMQLLAQHPLLFAALAFVFAATIGSFLNVVIHRLPIMMKRAWQQECSQYLLACHADKVTDIAAELRRSSDGYPQTYNLVLPGSACPSCHAAIKPWHNLPLVSWLLLGGKCASCRAPISRRYPLIEALTGAAVAYLAWHFGPGWPFVFASLLTFALITLTAIDLDEMLLPDQITLPLLWLGLLLNLSGTFASASDAVIGAAAGYLSLWSVYWGFKLLTGKEGMGYGDFKLLAVFGAWLGWQMLPLIILLSSVVGALVGMALMLNKRITAANPIPFGPYIALAGWIAMIWGQPILGWYLSTLS